MRWDAFRKRICFPVRDDQGRLRGLHGRDATGENSLPYLMYPHEHQTNPHIWLGEHYCDPEKTVVIAESVFDLARVYEHYTNVISPLTASLSKAKIDRLAGISAIVTLFDEDKAGMRARDKLTKYLSKVELLHVSPCEAEDAADLTSEEMRALLEELELL